MLDEAGRLNGGLTTPAFEVGHAENRRGVSLFRRKQLKDFIDETDQAAAILNFLEESHKKLEACGAQDSRTLPPRNVTRRELASTNSFTNPAVVVNRTLRIPIHFDGYVGITGQPAVFSTI